MKCEGWRCDSLDARKRRQNTNYTNDADNWVILCDKCFAENEEYWAEMWESVR